LIPSVIYQANGSSIFSFLRTSELFSMVAIPIYIPNSRCMKVPFPLRPCQHLLVFVFLMIVILTG
jgi:hypothetical protein